MDWDLDNGPVMHRPEFGVERFQNVGILRECRPGLVILVINVLFESYRWPFQFKFGARSD